MYHSECKERHSSALSRMANDLSAMLTAGESYDTVQKYMEKCQKDSFVTTVEAEAELSHSIDRWASESHDKYTVVLDFIRTLPDDLKNKAIKLPSVSSLWDTAIPARLSELICQESIDSMAIENLRKESKEVGVDDSRLEVVISAEFKKRIDAILEDGIIDDEEEEYLSNFIKQTGFDPNSLPSLKESYYSFVQALILKDISHDGESHRLDLPQSSLLLSKGEYPIWVYNDIDAYMDKTGKQYVGGNNGVSFKICKGVYYRTGASKGHSVNYDYTESQGRGSLIITNKAVYFVGAKTIKIIIKKIINLEPYSDGIKIQKEGVRNNSFTFVGFDSWFMMNLLPMLND